MKDDSAFSIVVLPDPVPPEISTFIRAPTAAWRNAAAFRLNAPWLTSFSIVSLSAENLRIESDGPSMAQGRMIAFTRLPSGRRASTHGWLSSIRRPTRLTILSMILSRCFSSRNVVGARSSRPPRSTKTLRWPLTRMSETLSSASSGSSGPSPITSSISSPTSRLKLSDPIWMRLSFRCVTTSAEIARRSSLRSASSIRARFTSSRMISCRRCLRSNHALVSPCELCATGAGAGIGTTFRVSVGGTPAATGTGLRASLPPRKSLKIGMLRPSAGSNS